MTSRRYNTYKFLYTNDQETTTIKRQRSYLEPDGTEITPLTPLFFAREVVFNEKVTGSSANLRHVLAYIGTGRFKANIPYSPNDLILIDHVEEILAVERVICGDYRGEIRSFNANGNSFSG